jgi:hypothetical protein
VSRGARRAPISANSATSRLLWSRNRSHAARDVTARRVAGTLIPGRPATSTGRVRPQNIFWAVSAATTGPVQASRTTSGHPVRIRRMSAACVRTSTGRLLVARICAADGMIGFSMSN